SSTSSTISSHGCSRLTALFQSYRRVRRRVGLPPSGSPTRQCGLDDLLRHAGVFPLHHVVGGERASQRLLVHEVDQEVRGEALLLELDQLGEEVGGRDRRTAGRGGGSGRGRRGLARP